MRPSDCSGKNWRDVGSREVLASSVDPSMADHHEKWCTVGTFNRAEYEAGYAIGLKAYCTPSHFFYKGEMGGSVRIKMCPPERKDELWSHYSKGLDLNWNKRAYLRLKERMEENEKEGGSSLWTSSFSDQQELDELNTKIDQAIAVAPDYDEYCRNEKEGKELFKKMTPKFILNLAEVAGDKTLEECSRKKPKAIQ